MLGTRSAGRPPGRGRSGPGAPDAFSLEGLIQALGQVRALTRAGLAGERAWVPLLGPAAGRSGLAATGAAAAAPWESRLAAWATAAGGAPVAPYARAVMAVHRVAGAAGASTADLLDAVIAGLDDAQETDDARAVAVAGPKSSARLLQFLPLLGLALGTAMGARPLGVLFGGGAGTVALLVGLGLLGAGQIWSAALLRAASQAAGAEPIAAAVLAAALRAGLPLPAALSRVGTAWEGPLGEALAQVGAALARGEPWDLAWRAGASGEVGGGSARDHTLVGDLRSTLWLVWDSGVEAGPLLEALCARLGRAERRRLTQAAARLGVYLMAPLGLCYLPAFVALGLVPVLLSLANGIVPGL